MIRRVLRKLFTVPGSGTDTDRLKPLIDSGNLKIGLDSDLHKCSIHIQGARSGFENITIGDNCVVEGRIILHSDKARVKIGNRVFIGANAMIFCYDCIEIGDDVMFSWDCTVIDTNAHSLRSDERKADVLDWKKGPEHKNWSVVASGKVTIGNSCWIGFRSIIMKGVELGEGCVVAAGSVVTKSFQPYSVIGGNPASFIKTTC